MNTLRYCTLALLAVPAIAQPADAYVYHDPFFGVFPHMLAAQMHHDMQRMAHNNHALSQLKTDATTLAINEDAKAGTTTVILKNITLDGDVQAKTYNKIPNGFIPPHNTLTVTANQTRIQVAVSGTMVHVELAQEHQQTTDKDGNKVGMSGSTMCSQSKYVTSSPEISDKTGIVYDKPTKTLTITLQGTPQEQRVKTIPVTIQTAPAAAAPSTLTPAAPQVEQK